jgi:hypothetical protein
MIVSKMNLIIYKGQTMATYLEHLLQKFDSATLEVRELSRNDYTFNDVKNIVVICSSELEIFLKLAAFPSQNQRYNFVQFIDELLTVGVSQIDIDTLHELRLAYNALKHNPMYEPQLLEVENLIKRVKSSLMKLITFSFGRISEQVAIRHRRILWFFAWDHFIGGDTEVSIMIPSMADELPLPLDDIYINMSDWYTVKSELISVGSVAFGKELFPERVYEFYSNESDFLAAGIFEGEYKDLIKTFAKYELRQDLISGLNRHDSFFSMFQASILAMVEVASTFETEPTKENLQIEILNCCVDNYAVPSEYQHLSKFVDSLTNLLKQLDFSLWKVLSGPTWISKLSFDIEKKYALVINNELNILFDKNGIVRIQLKS